MIWICFSIQEKFICSCSFSSQYTENSLQIELSQRPRSLLEVDMDWVYPGPNFSIFIIFSDVSKLFRLVLKTFHFLSLPVTSTVLWLATSWAFSLPRFLPRSSRRRSLPYSTWCPSPYCPFSLWRISRVRIEVPTSYLFNNVIVLVTALLTPRGDGL